MLSAALDGSELFAIRAAITMTETHSEKSSLPADAAREVARRRTFAIISHPDAGKTTLTEKFLLYGGAVQLAGSVTARKDQRATTSDLIQQVVSV